MSTLVDDLPSNSRNIGLGDELDESAAYQGEQARDVAYEGDGYQEVSHTEKEINMEHESGLAAALAAAALSNRDNGDRDGALIAAILRGNGCGFGGWGGWNGGCGFPGWGDWGRRDGMDPFEAATLKGLGDIQGAIPNTALQTQNSILESQNALSNQISQSAIAVTSTVNGVKDAVNQNATALLLAGNQNTAQIIAAIGALGNKMDTFKIADLERQLGVAQLQNVETRLGRGAGDVEVTVKNVMSQMQGQLQAQRQSDDTRDLLSKLLTHINVIGNQVARSSQDIINVGGVLAGASNTANPTNIK